MVASLGIIPDKDEIRRTKTRSMIRDAVREHVLEEKKENEGLTKLEKAELARIKVSRILNSDLFQPRCCPPRPDIYNDTDKKIIEGIAKIVGEIAVGLYQGVVEQMFPKTKPHQHVDDIAIKMLKNMGEKELSLKKNRPFATLISFERMKSNIKKMPFEQAEKIEKRMFKFIANDMKKYPDEYKKGLKELKEILANSENLSKFEKTVLKDKMGTLAAIMFIADSMDTKIKA